MFNWGLKRPSMISVTNLNDTYASTINDVGIALGGKSKDIYRKRLTRRVFVIDFDGDVIASQAKGLAFEVTSIICNAKPGDEVLVRLNSPGGAAHAYGYAAEQIARLKRAGIYVTVAVDKVAASGGYLMACVADRIISAPWAIIGSIGVVAEFPNFFNFLKNLGIDYKQYTAGEFKRTVTPLGPVTTEGEKKFEEDLHDTYDFFRKHVASHRPILAEKINTVATGEHWNGATALDLDLVDEVKTSEEYIIENLKTAEFIQIKYVGDRKTLAEKLGASLAVSFAEGLVKTFFNSLVNLAAKHRMIE